MPQAIDEQAIEDKSKGNQSFDVTKPPLKSIPHSDYPKMLYLWPKDKTLPVDVKTAIANDAGQEKSLTQKGYRIKPHTQQFPEQLPDGFEADLPAKSN